MAHFSAQHDSGMSGMRKADVFKHQKHPANGQKQKINTHLEIPELCTHYNVHQHTIGV